MKLLVTGATGLLGSVICRIGIERGHAVTALVRDADRAHELAELGVELTEGDILSPDSLTDRVFDTDAVIHAAAILGGSFGTAPATEVASANYLGTVHVLAAAERTGTRGVMISSTAILDWSHTLTETSPITPIRPHDTAYTAAKRAAFYETMRRASLGQDVSSVLPTGIYGPGVVTERALHPSGFTGAMRRAIVGEIEPQPGFPFMWVYVDDVADTAIRAAQQGELGGRYLATGRLEDRMSLPGLLNLACSAARSAHRVGELDPATQPGAGPTGSSWMDRPAGADPFSDSSATEAALGTRYTSLRDGVAATVDWLRAVEQIPTE